jgi:HlyD family secretion protein
MASDPKSNRTATYIIWGSALIVLVLAVFSIRSLTREHVTVYVAQVAYGDLVKTSSTNGTVEPISDFQAHAKVAGQVEDIYVDVGQKVKAHQLLLKMEDADALARLASANSALQAAELAESDIEHGGTQDERNTSAGDMTRAKLQLQKDQASLASLKNLQQQGAASPAEIAALQEQIELDQSTLHTTEQHSNQRYDQADRARAQAQLADARAAVAAAQSGYDSADIRTPIDGTVYYLPISQYDYVKQDEDLVFVADLARLRVTAYFDEPEIGNLAAGQPVKIVWEAKPNIIWHGHISLAPTTVINYNLTRNVGECTITVDDNDGVLQPNATVTVTVTTAEHKHVLSVPREALHTENSQPYVFRVINDKLVRTPVQVSASSIVNNNFAEIASGLAEGDTVALNATTNRDLTDGLEVHPTYK